MRMFKRRRDGTTVVTLPGVFVDVLTQVVGELRELLADPPAGAVTDRLFPRAYLDPTEEAAEAEWQSLVHDDLTRDRLDALTLTAAELSAAEPAARETRRIVLDDDGANRWCMVLNDARLTIGTALGVSEDEDLDFPDDDPRRAAAEVYDVLGYVQQELVEVLFETLPEEGTVPDD